ncbi:unnamed protein product, partial [marine sediment metagenome]
DDLVKRYGTDSVRLYELFIGPAEMNCEWTDRGIEGTYRFLKKTWDIILKLKGKYAPEREDVLRKRHTLIRDVSNRIKLFKFNTAISSFMEFINWLNESEVLNKGIDRKSIETFLILLAPFAPHFSEELWETTEHSDSIFKEKWPEHTPSLVKAEVAKIAIQVNGKLRGVLELSKEVPQEEVVKEAKALAGVAKHLRSRHIKKVIFVPGKIVNFVVSKDSVERLADSV